MAPQPSQTPAIVADDDDNELSSLGNDQPVVAPVTVPPIAGDTGDFQIVETDDNGNELEAPLTDGGGTYLDQQQAQQQPGQQPTKSQKRRERQRTFARKNKSENEELRQQLNELARQNQFLMERMGTVLEPGLGEITRGRLHDRIAAVDSGLAEQDAKFNAAKSAMQRAMADNDSEAVLKAMDDRDAAILAKTRLETEKGQLQAAGQQMARAQQAPPQQRAPQRAQEPAAPPLNGNGQRYLAEFSRGLDWFDARPDTSDRDSRTLQFLDNEVLREGFDPNSEAYWEELEARAQEMLPHRFLEEQPAAQPQARQAAPQSQRQAAPRSNVTPLRRGPAVGGGAEGAPRGGNGGGMKVKVSPERKSAMIEVGALTPDGRVGNREKFNRLMKSYHEYDSANPS